MRARRPHRSARHPRRGLPLHGEGARRLETYFAYRTTEDIELEDAVWTDIEKRSLLEFRWWSREEPLETTETIYPRNLLSLMELASRGAVPDVPLVID